MMDEGRNVRLTEQQTIMMNLLKQSGGSEERKEDQGLGQSFSQVVTHPFQGKREFYLVKVCFVYAAENLH